jgi:hypothetical protein
MRREKHEVGPMLDELVRKCRHAAVDLAATKVGAGYTGFAGTAFVYAASSRIMGTRRLPK